MGDNTKKQVKGQTNKALKKDRSMNQVHGTSVNVPQYAVSRAGFVQNPPWNACSGI